MSKKWMFVCLTAVLMLVLAACGGGDKKDSNQSAASSSPAPTTAANATAQPTAENTNKNATKTIQYLGQSYTVPQNVQKIVITGAMEAMEDATVLGVEPTGAITVAGKFPELYAAATGKSQSIGEKQQPNFEKILELKPDVILGTTKFQKEAVEKLQKIAPTILVSHISTNWEANLKLMAELGGKTSKAEELLSKYKVDTQAARESLKTKLQGKKVAAVRIRGAQMYVYPKDVYFNPVLYDELALEVPSQIAAAKLQDALSVEQLAVMNPDYLFVQYVAAENQDAQNAFEELKKNPIVQNVKAFKENRVYVNVVDPLLEGGPALSRVLFLESAQKHLDK